MIMKKIRYVFRDGTVSEVEVGEEFYAVYEAMDKADKLRERRETRRHISWEGLEESGFDIADKDFLFTGIDEEKSEKESEKERLYEAMAKLLPSQRELINKIYYEGKTSANIAAEEGVGKSAVSNRLKRIFSVLRKNLEKTP